MMLGRQQKALSVVAVDDERIALDGIMLQLSRIDRVDQVRGFTSPQEALEYLCKNSADVAFLDINMRGMDGLALAARIKEACPQCVIIFLTGYAEFAIDAFKVKAYGYLLKPTRTEDIVRELEGLDVSVPNSSANESPLVRVQTFGDFEVFVGDDPLRFPRRKCKEVLAYLIDRKGAGVTSARLATVIWEGRGYDRSVQKQVQTVLSDLTKALNDAGVGSVITRFRNHIAIDPTKIDCDCYRFFEGDSAAIRLFSGEYMVEYSWAEQTAGELQRIRREI